MPPFVQQIQKRAEWVDTRPPDLGRGAPAMAYANFPHQARHLYSCLEPLCRLLPTGDIGTLCNQHLPNCRSGIRVECRTQCVYTLCAYILIYGHMFMGMCVVCNSAVCVCVSSWSIHKNSVCVRVCEFVFGYVCVCVCVCVCV